MHQKIIEIYSNNVVESFSLYDITFSWCVWVDSGSSFGKNNSKMIVSLA